MRLPCAVEHVLQLDLYGQCMVPRVLINVSVIRADPVTLLPMFLPLPPLQRPAIFECRDICVANLLVIVIIIIIIT